ncbi:MAG: hypothetical protein HPY69_02820 [Armatimonadetes bacterium]|nr:hypothetical protein [Armatimonadota bacterium]
MLLVVGGVGAAELKFSGWLQMRYNEWDSDLSPMPDTFDLRRMRLTVDGKLGERTKARVQIEIAGFDDTNGVKGIEYKNWYLEHQLTQELSSTLGYNSATFGIEVPMSNAKIIPLERSQAALKLFPGERDTGVYLHWMPTSGSWPQVSVGLSDGITRWQDLDKKGDKDTDSEAWYARVQWPLPRKGVVGASYRSADRTHRASGILTDYQDDLLGLHARYVFPEHWALQAEYYDGEDLGKDVMGWYGQAEYALGSRPVTVFYRYDMYDFGGSDDFTRDTAGLVWYRTKADQFTLQAESYDDGKGGSFTNWGLQYQVAY